MENIIDDSVENPFNLADEIKQKNDISTNYESEVNISSNNSSLLNESVRSSSKKTSIDDFYLTKVIGKGSYAKVVLGMNLNSNKIYALKIIDKYFLEKENKEYQANIEKTILFNLKHPNIVNLYSTMQDKAKLYYIMEYCPNGDLSDFIKQNGVLTKELAAFFTAEIISGLEYIHTNGVIHRDIKPENITLDSKFHLKIVDFATATMKNMIFDKQRKTFVPYSKQVALDCDSEKYNFECELIGSPEYLSPEIIMGEEPTEAVDFWALGCVVYLFFHGNTPFKDKYQENLFEKIRNCEYTLRSDLDSDAKDLIIKLLEFDPKKRLSAFCNKDIKKPYNNRNYETNDKWYFENTLKRNEIEILNENVKNLSIEENSDKNVYTNFINGIKSHPFFKHVNFKNLQNTKVPLDAECSSLHSFNGINNNINDLSIFNSANNNMNFSKNNFNNLYSPEKTNKDYKNKNSHEIQITSSVERISNVTFFTNNTSDSSFYTETNDEKNLNAQGNLNMKASNSNHNNGASPFKFDESVINGNHDRINLETEIYSSNNSFLFFLQEEKRKSKNRLEKFYQEKSNSGDSNVAGDSVDENIVILEEILDKKSPWFHYNTRFCKLYKSGKLEYYNPSNMLLKGNIQLDSKCKSNLIDENKFSLETSSRTFLFKSYSYSAKLWVKSMSEIIKKSNSENFLIGG